MQHARREIWFIPLLALIPLLLYVTLGYGGQDFSYHVTAWMELHEQWVSHVWTLGWSAWAQHGFGEPSFCFYPPLSFVVSAALSFLLPMRWVPGLIVWLVLSLSGLAMYVAAGCFVGQRNRFLAAVLYMFNPYLLVTVILRYAIAEAWVQALWPLIFLCFYQAVAERRRSRVIPTSMLVALGWLTNIPEAIVIFYALGLVALVLGVRRRSVQPVASMVLCQVLALALAAFRLLPTLSEKAWVSSQALLAYNFSAYMQFKRIPPPHVIVFFCGFFMLTAGGIAVLATLQSQRANRRWSDTTMCIAALSIFAVVLQVPPSTPLWQHLPEFKFILFPFRLLPLLSLGVVLLLIADGVSPKLQKRCAVVLLLLGVYPFLAYTRLLPFQRFSSIAVAMATWRQGFEGVREYVPVAVPPARSEPALEKHLQAQGPFASTTCSPVLRTALQNMRLVTTGAAIPCTLELNTFYYPFWTANIDNASALPVSANANGLLAMSVPAGAHKITIRFLPSSRLRTAAAFFSAATFLLLTLWMAASWRRPARRAFPLPSV